MNIDDYADGPAQLGGITTDEIRIHLRIHKAPIEGLRETDAHRSFSVYGPTFDKRRPEYSDGFGHDLDERACFLKRWFEFPDLGARGWAFIFQDHPPPGENCEHFLGWVPPEREAEADRWIAFMNAETQRLLRADAAERRGQPSTAGG